MEARRIRLQGEHGISRQAIAQGMPECSGCTCMLVCATLYTIAHETAGAASTRHSLLPLALRERNFSKARAQRAAGMQRHICVGWVERSESHHPCAGLDGYRFALPILRIVSRDNVITPDYPCGVTEIRAQSRRPISTQSWVLRRSAMLTASRCRWRSAPR